LDFFFSNLNQICFNLVEFIGLVANIPTNDKMTIRGTIILDLEIEKKDVSLLDFLMKKKKNNSAIR